MIGRARRMENIGNTEGFHHKLVGDLPGDCDKPDLDQWLRSADICVSFASCLVPRAISLVRSVATQIRMLKVSVITAGLMQRYINLAQAGPRKKVWKS